VNPRTKIGACQECEKKRFHAAGCRLADIAEIRAMEEKARALLDKHRAYHGCDLSCAVRLNLLTAWDHVRAAEGASLGVAPSTMKDENEMFEERIRVASDKRRFG
jgi:hypothetical protein